MKDIKNIERFKEESTWRLFGLGAITFGIYFAHYIKKQTSKINETLSNQEKIPDSYVNSILALSYVTLVLFVGSLFVTEHHPLVTVSNILNNVWAIMILIWGFKARNRLNSIYEISKNDKEWFHGFWTFFFSPMYFNYKINSICAESVEHIESTDS